MARRLKTASFYTKTYTKWILIKEVRRAAAKSFYKTLNAYKNTVANEYISQLKKEKMMATMRGYDSVIDYLLDEQDGDRELYDRQIRMLMTDLAPLICNALLNY